MKDVADTLASVPAWSVGNTQMLYYAVAIGRFPDCQFYPANTRFPNMDTPTLLV